VDVGDGNLPEDEGFGRNVVGCGLLFLFDDILEGPHRLVRPNLDRKDVI
jgi:hypothetical protein